MALRSWMTLTRVELTRRACALFSSSRWGRVCLGLRSAVSRVRARVLAVSVTLAMLLTACSSAPATRAGGYRAGATTAPIPLLVCLLPGQARPCQRCPGRPFTGHLLIAESSRKKPDPRDQPERHRHLTLSTARRRWRITRCARRRLLHDWMHGHRRQLRVWPGCAGGESAHKRRPVAGSGATSRRGDNLTHFNNPDDAVPRPMERCGCRHQ